MERLTKRYSYHLGTEIDLKRNHGKKCIDFCSLCTKCIEVKDALFKLAAYEDFVEQMNLPCEVGCFVYEIYFSSSEEGEIIMKKFKFEDLKKIGNTVFLTHEAAEAALERQQASEPKVGGKGDE